MDTVELSARAPKPYLELNPDDFEEITCRPVTRFKNLRSAFKNLDWGLKAAENTLLELARFYGVYEVLTEFLDDTSDFQIGPRGGMTQSFDLFFKRSARALFSTSIWVSRSKNIHRKYLRRNNYDYDENREPNYYYIL